MPSRDAGVADVGTAVAGSTRPTGLVLGRGGSLPQASARTRRAKPREGKKGTQGHEDGEYCAIGRGRTEPDMYRLTL